MSNEDSPGELHATGLRPKPAIALGGGERFDGIDANVIDFWRWSYSDLRDNTIRGVLAEFFVTHALGCTGKLRESWANFDVMTPKSRLRVEVKSSGYLQSWPQRRRSRLDFGKLIGRSWDAETGELSAEREVRADVYVFCAQTCDDPDAYDALDLSQWEFYVVPGAAVRRAGARSVGIGFVRANATAGPLALPALAQAVEAAGLANHPAEPSSESPVEPGATV
jgi:hypothetical protein